MRADEAIVERTEQIEPRANRFGADRSGWAQIGDLEIVLIFIVLVLIAGFADEQRCVLRAEKARAVGRRIEARNGAMLTKLGSSAVGLPSSFATSEPSVG